MDSACQICSGCLLTRSPGKATEDESGGGQQPPSRMSLFGATQREATSRMSLLEMTLGDHHPILRFVWVKTEGHCK